MDALPCADAAFLVPLKRSRTYGTIRPRVADLRPVDSWQQEGLHLFVFQLRADGANGVADTPESPVAVFAMHPDSKEPVSAIVVRSIPGGQFAEVKDVLPKTGGNGSAG